MKCTENAPLVNDALVTMSHKNKLYRTHLARNSTLKRENFFLFKTNVFGVMIFSYKNVTRKTNASRYATF
jgi:hypothetical protein